MRELAEAQIGNNTKITQVVLTVSGGFDRIPRQVIHQAVEEQYKTEGDTAGLKVLRVLKRHIAAAVAYGFDNEFLYGSNGVREPGVRELVVVNVEETVFDVGVWELDSGVYEKMGFVERRAHGDGGFNEEAADRTVMERLVEEFLRGAGYSISVEEEAEVQRQREKILSDEALVGRLRKEVFKVNNVFSAASLHLQPVIDTTFDTPSRHTVRINIEPFFEDRDLSVSLDLPQWQDLRERSLRTILDAIDEGLEMSEVVFDHTSGTTKPLDKSEVDHVVVMGSSTRTPEVVQLIERYFQGRLSVPMTIEPMFLGVMGAAKIALAFEGHVECLLA
ncbi:Endoplasmic reticulum chaperone BiP [Haplosporangium gracile]|nr:Endoplasmic reticulum chaperone BiP [Haplosporangium gracile]